MTNMPEIDALAGMFMATIRASPRASSGSQ
jgi:hypothetical protein